LLILEIFRRQTSPPVFVKMYLDNNWNGYKTFFTMISIYFFLKKHYTEYFNQSLFSLNYKQIQHHLLFICNVQPLSVVLLRLSFRDSKVQNFNTDLSPTQPFIHFFVNFAIFKALYRVSNIQRNLQNLLILVRPFHWWWKIFANCLISNCWVNFKKEYWPSAFGNFARSTPPRFRDPTVCTRFLSTK